MKDTNNRDKSKISNKYIVTITAFAIIALITAAGYFIFKNSIVKTCLFSAVILGLTAMALFFYRRERLIKRISDSLSGLINEKAELTNEIEVKDEYIRGEALSALLEGKPIEDSAGKMLPQFDGPLSVLYIVYGRKTDAEDADAKVRELAYEYFSKTTSVFFAQTQTPGALSAIIEFGDSSDDLKENIEAVSGKFIKELKRWFDIESDVIFGRITENPNELASIYREVRDAAFICLKDGCVIDAEKIAERSYDVYNYSVDTEISIIIYIKKGDFPKAYGLIRNALDEILYQRGYPIYIIRCFMFEIAGTILKAIGETQQENGINLGCSKELGKIFLTDSVIEMELILKEYLKEVCERISESNKGIASPFCEKIKQYVRENYADLDMNVNAIAARFYINPAYLSNLFKRNTDIKLLDYINKVRIDEAKKMIIANPDITIEQLSEKSGFKNSRTFRRIFMKYENMSPSKFAKM